MTEDGTIYICESCREPVDEDDPGVVRAHELIYTPTMDGDDEPLEGPGVFFHEAHFPSSSTNYRRSS